MKPTLALILLAAAAGTAAAQPPTTEPVGGVTEPAEPPQPPQPPQPPRPPSAGVAKDDGGSEASTGRPEGISFGIGIGYTLPTSIQMPNTTSVRMRLAGGLTLEPIIVLGNSTTKQNAATDSKDSRTEFTVAGLVRLPVVRHRKIELELLGAIGFGTVKDNPDGADNNTTTSTIGLSWGLAVSYWITSHWNFTFSARNPLLSINKATRQMPAPGVETETSTTNIAIEFAPIVSAMIHLYN